LGKSYFAGGDRKFLRRARASKKKANRKLWRESRGGKAAQERKNEHRWKKKVKRRGEISKSARPGRGSGSEQKKRGGGIWQEKKSSSEKKKREVGEGKWESSSFPKEHTGPQKKKKKK